MKAKTDLEKFMDSESECAIINKIADLETDKIKVVCSACGSKCEYNRHTYTKDKHIFHYKCPKCVTEIWRKET